MSDALWSTGDLMRQLHDGALNEVLQRDVSLPPFPDYIAQMCLERGEPREYAIRRAGIERSYGYQLFNGTRKPSRDKAIQLAIGFELGADQAQELLRAAEKNTLEPRKKRDAALLFCLAREMDVEDTQKLLERHELEPLGQFER